MNFLGRPPINTGVFAAGKMALAGCWLALGVRAVHPDVALYRHPAVSLAALVLFVAGSGIILISLANLGASTRVGLPLESTVLKTRGLYRFSRNPMYLGLHLTCLAATVWVAHPVVLVLCAVSIAVHHRIVRAEEGFLAQTFGEEWHAYAARVRRYL